MPPSKADRLLAATSSGSGPSVVLVHGFTQTKASWRHIADALSAKHHVVAVDLPDHGGSTDVHAADLVEAARLLGRTGGPATYVGYSLGGRTCLTLALEQPELVEALVLIGATPGITTEHERAARRASDGALADRLDPPDGTAGLDLSSFLAEWLAGPLFAHLSPEQSDVAARLENTTAGLAASLRTVGTGTQIPSHDRLSALAMPVLLVAGEMDTRFTAIAHEMAAGIGANATVEIVAGSGHAVPFEAPEAFVSLLRDFLERR